MEERNKKGNLKLFFVLEEIYRKIKNIEIQGAENVAKACLDAAEWLIQNDPEKFEPWMEKLANVRPTEPAARRVTHILLATYKEKGEKEVLKAIGGIREKIEKSREKIAEYGARKIPDGGCIITHCHSSTLMSVFETASKKKEFKVIVTETRPLYQGKITARELGAMGIEVVYVVDSAAYYFMHEADIYMTGADAVTADGYVVNKIGTALIACAAKRFSVPYYAVCSSLKFDERTVEGFPEPIEERDPKEVLEEDLGVNVVNPAFDMTPPDLVTGIISEFGVLTVEAFIARALKGE